ncbi:Zinc finger protein CONSTANS-LIKE 12 [Ranunculus cassubicifolius]
MRYNEKKKNRTFGKQIRYASRKARVDIRKRVMGRFVKAGDAFDYDPLPSQHERKIETVYALELFSCKNQVEW